MHRLTFYLKFSRQRNTKCSAWRAGWVAMTASPLNHSRLQHAQIWNNEHKLENRIKVWIKFWFGPFYVCDSTSVPHSHSQNSKGHWPAHAFSPGLMTLSFEELLGGSTQKGLHGSETSWSHKDQPREVLSLTTSQCKSTAHHMDSSGHAVSLMNPTAWGTFQKRDLLGETQVLKTREWLWEPIGHLPFSYTEKEFLPPNLIPVYLSFIVQCPNLLKAWGRNCGGVCVMCTTWLSPSCDTLEGAALSSYD